MVHRGGWSSEKSGYIVLVENFFVRTKNNLPLEQKSQSPHDGFLSMSQEELYPSGVEKESLTHDQQRKNYRDQ